MNRKLSSALLLFSVLSLISLAGCLGKPEETGEKVAVSRGDLAITVPADGNLALITERNLAFGISGTVREVRVEEGETVSEGDLLASLDTESLERSVLTAELAVKSAEIDLEMATDAYRKITYPYTYYTFALGIPESLAAIADASREVENISGSISGSLSAPELSDLRQRLKDAQDSLTLAKEKLGRGQGPDLFTSGQLPLSSFWTLRDAQLGMEKAELALDKAENDLRHAEDELPKAFITAPFRGVVEQVNAKVGDRISQSDGGAKTIFQLIDPDALELTATVDEVDIAGLRIGQKAAIILDALPGLEIQGTVSYIAATSRIKGGVIAYDIKIRLEPTGTSTLKEGMTAKADVVIMERQNVLLIPEKAVYLNSSGESAVKVSVDGAWQERIVKTGLRNGTYVEVLEGLEETDLVLAQARAKAA